MSPAAIPAVPELFACAGGPSCVLVAVSGGPDSMALLHLAARWRDAGGPEVHAATVDHDLRPGSRAEADQVALWAGALDIPHHILTWTGERPKTKLQELARAARYRLLEGLVHELGAEVVLTGHHADDQAETILFRLLRGSGIAGLAAMAQVSQRSGFRLVRPLLDVPKADLVAFCEAVGQPYFIDPSNRDPRFARTDLKRVLALFEAEGLGPAELLRLGRRAARTEEALRACVADLRTSLDPVVSAGLFECAAAPLRTVPQEILLRLLEAEISRLGDGVPRLDRLERLGAEVRAAIVGGGLFAGTLAGALLRVTRLGRLVVATAPPRKGGIS